MVILGHNLGNSQVSVYRTIGPTLVKCSYLDILLSFLTEIGEIICTTTQHGGKSIIYDRFSYRLDRAGDKVLDWRSSTSPQ